MAKKSNVSVYHHTIDWRAFGTGLGLFFMISFILCVGFDLIFPGQAMYQSWIKLLPGFSWISWGSFFLGAIESLAYGYYFALVFCPLYNHFSKVFAVRDERQKAGAETTKTRGHRLQPGEV